MDTKICPQCKNPFGPREKDSGNFRRQKFCSRACSQASYKFDPDRAIPALWEKVDKSGDCWIWMGAKHRANYGHVNFLGRHMNAHRAAWEITNGPPGSMLVLHRCDNPPCVNPAHLFLGTQKDNMRDKAKKLRFPKALPAENIRAIRELLGRVPERQIALKFNTTITTVNKIKRGKSYADVA